MIRVENLTKSFGDVHAVNGLNFELYDGEILGFLGPNGAGKTTTMRILTCFFPPTSGRAMVAGYDVSSEPDQVRRVIGYMPEGVPLYKEMTVFDYLDFIGHAKGYGGKQRRAYINTAIEETNLGVVQHRAVGTLSKGYRQRVGLAQAILGDPRVLILDEPTSGLDPRQIADMRALIKGMAGRRTVILSTHILPEVQMTCSRVIIIDKGRIAASGTPEKLTTRVQNRFEYQARLLTDDSDVVAALKDLPGVLSAEEMQIAQGQGSVRGLPGTSRDFTVVCGIETPDLRPQIAKLAVAKDWSVIELRQIGLSLEDIFLQAVAGERGTRTDNNDPITTSEKPVVASSVATAPTSSNDTPAHGTPVVASASVAARDDKQEESK